ncbi:MAG: hypothetical protein DMG92_09925 [Acidobacteria bacterium]|nr:MAG: hypothetical protein DMG92_09925 [Acidobacteriota bacterium]
MKANLAIRGELRLARLLWGNLNKFQIENLFALVSVHRLSVKRGDLLLLDGKWYVTHAGLLLLACRKHCLGVQVRPVQEFWNNELSRFAFRAKVYKSEKCRGFDGYGDADASNVSPLMHGSEMRIAETRAVNRALRKAYGIGICSVEEIGPLSGLVQTKSQSKNETKKLPPRPENGNGTKENGTRVRDRLCQIIRQHQLDPVLVKAYAIDFCGTKTLRDARREQVESFVAHISDWAQKDRNALLCQLNSYLSSQEGAA